MDTEKHKVVKILSVFTDEDWKNFGLFLKSPYLTGGRDYTLLYNELYRKFKQCVKFDADTFEKFKKSVFRKSKLSERTKSNRLSELTSLAEKFVQQKYFRNDNNVKDYYLLKFYVDNSLFPEFRARYKLDTEKINLAEISSRDFFVMYETANLKLLYDIETQKYNDLFKGFHQSTMLFAAKGLQMFFHFASQYKLLDGLEVNNEMNPVNDILNNMKLEPLIKIIENYNSPAFMLPLLQYYVFEMIVNDRGEKFIQKFEKLFFDKSINFDKSVKMDLSLTVENYYWEKINKGHTRFLKPLYRIQRHKLVNGRLSTELKGGHSTIAFDNHVALCLMMNKFDEAKKFMALNVDIFPEDEREDVYILSMIKIHNAEGKFSKALNLIEERKQRNVYNGSILRWKFRMLYELKMQEEAMLEIDKVRHYLKNRKEVTDFEKKRTLHFLKYFSKLLKVQNDPEHKGMDELRMKIDKSKAVIMAIDWIKEKMNEI